MPRPKNGYTNAAGQPVPGTTDITSRYMSPEGLYRWYYNNGKNGLPFYTRSAIDIGSAVHKMAELDLIGASDREIEATLYQYLSARNHLEMANNAFRSFRQWREQNRVRVLGQEVSLVSERYQYGGTPDLIAIINNTIGILDFKSSSKGEIYDNMKIALAAHANLWNEANPKTTIDTHHLIVLPKDGGIFKHHAFDDLSREWQMFRLQRELYALEKGGSFASRRRATTQGAASKEKPRIRVKMRTSLTMPEMLRAVDKHEADRIWSRPITSTLGQKPLHGLFGGAP
jgi:hypothetical protein